MKEFFALKDPQAWQKFMDLLKQAVIEDKLEEVLSMLLTIEERNSLGLRVQVIRLLLEKNLSQRDIQKVLNTSIATVTRGSNMLKTVNPEMLEWANNKLNDKS
ncbi:Trp operon repressor [Phocoenobacter uteri]|uniref:Trp operon repressor homolog n=1 Tax=Phocoenobacter uteri TaxID=146806 RepID=A0A379CAX1_9PAST|nr:trp operon repressor [Phocoenobacter uteri]MDG6882679.1 Trp operon repressor [Phocoenobacter uteri]SUB58846.1 Trp operon repressor [Phocoenobacter uteri]